MLLNLALSSDEIDTQIAALLKVKANTMADIAKKQCILDSAKCASTDT